MRYNTVLVTGAAGFIGSHVCSKLLRSGIQVIGVDNFDPFYDREIKEQNLAPLRPQAGFVFYEMDITSAASYEIIKRPVDAVIHLAAKAGVLPSLKNPLAYIHSNISGTQVLSEWMIRANIRKLVFASSSSVYGNNKKIPFAEEDSVDRPISPYAYTKKTCELLNYTNHHLYGIDVVNLRFFTVYGERQRPDLAIHKFVRLLTEKKPITVYGDGETSRDYTYIDDTLNGVMASLNYVVSNQGIYEIINLGNNKPVNLKKLIAVISEVLKVKPEIVSLPAQPGDVEITYADISKAQRLLGYQPSTKLEDGILKFVDWYLTAHLTIK